MNPVSLVLLSGVTTQITGAAQQWQGGVADLIVECTTINGATVTLQIYDDASQAWVALGASTTVTAAGIVAGVYVPAGAVRAVVSGANPSTALSAGLRAALN
jgi:hypothetical protein